MEWKRLFPFRREDLSSNTLRSRAPEPRRRMKRYTTAPRSLMERFWAFWTDAVSGGRYWLVRFLFLRGLGLVYFFAFLSLALQVLPLLGSNGLLPVEPHLRNVAEYYGSLVNGFVHRPSLFWFHVSDPLLLVLSWCGVVLALLITAGFANVPLMLVTWGLYLSFVHVGQVWYGYGWEIKLLEAGFLAIFLVPMTNPFPFSRVPPPAPVIWALRWLAVRIYVGAGLIKLRGDACWRDLTCLYHHFETQPIPNPLSPWFHRLPNWMLQAGVLWNHIVEVVVPFLVFFGRRPRTVAAVLMILFQVTLILSGNLSFLNWLTIVIVLSFLDDETLKNILPTFLTEKAERAAEKRTEASTARSVVTLLLTVVILVLSVPVTVNMLSPEQVMNTSFDPLRIVNSYGAFGSVTKTRHELIVEGTRDDLMTRNPEWRTYDFPAKPDDPEEPLPVVAPYQPRIAWQMWFAAMSTPDREPWLLHLVWKLLHNDPAALALVDRNPFPDDPPKYIRIRKFRYEFNGEEQTWQRTPVGVWLPPVSTNQQWIRDVVRNRWPEAYKKGKSHDKQ